MFRKSSAAGRGIAWLGMAAWLCLPAFGPAQVVRAPEAEEVVVLADDLAGGYGLPDHQMFPSVLLREARKESLRYQVRSAAGAGDKTRMGVRRLPVVLKVPRLRVVIVALGRSDAEAKVPPDEIRSNLASIVEQCVSNKVGVVLCGFRLPPGEDMAYSAGFSSVFPEVARAYKVPFVTNLLEGVEGVAEMNLSDGKHPNKDGQKRMADSIWAVLGPLLRGFSASASPASGG